MSFQDAEPGRLVGMIGGAVVYGAVAAGSATPIAGRAAAVVAIGMALIPAGVIGAWLAGYPVPTTPDAVMLGLAVLQWLAAALAALTLRGTGPGGPRAAGARSA